MRTNAIVPASSEPCGPIRAVGRLVRFTTPQFDPRLNRVTDYNNKASAEEGSGRFVKINKFNQFNNKFNKLFTAEMMKPPGDELLDSTCEAADVLGKALLHQQTCKSRLERVLTASEDGDVSKDELLSALREQHASLCHLGEDLSDRLAPSFYNVISPRGVAYSAMKLLGIREMLEHVASHLSIGELLRFEQVNKEMKDTIRASSALGRQFFFQQPSGHYTPRALGSVGPYTDDHENYAIDIYFGSSRVTDEWGDRTYTWRATSTPIVRAIIRGPAHQLPVMGERGRNRFICQPPVKMMRATTVCRYYQWDPDHEVSELVENNCGVTLGDLCESAEQMIDEHGGGYYGDDREINHEPAIMFRSVDEAEAALLRENLKRRSEVSDAAMNEFFEVF